MTTPTAILDFGKQVRNRPEIEPDVVETLVEFKESYFDDPDPTRWTVDEVKELMLVVLPRKVTAPDEWFAAVTPTMRAYLEFLAERGRLASGSDPSQALLRAVDRIGDGVLEASQDPRNFGMAKAIFSSVGFDPSLPDPARAAMEAFNALPDAERAAIVDPALRGLVPDDGAPQTGGGLSTGSADGPQLPMVWLPPAAELAPAVTAAPLVQDLLGLIAWCGIRRKVTRRKVLPLADARRACADLGLPVPTGPLGSAENIPALQRLWSLALDSDLLQIAGGAAARGEAADLLSDPDGDPDEIVSWWVQLLDTCLVEGPDPMGDVNEDEEDEDLDFDDIDWDNLDLDDEEVLNAVAESLPLILVELYSAGRLPLEVLDDAIRETVQAVLARPWTGVDMPEARVRELTVPQWRAYLEQLVAVGAAEVEDGELDLTPLGRVGVRAIALEDGAEAPLIDDPTSLDAAALLRVLPPLGESVGRPLLTAWARPRHPARAVDEILDAARAGTASTRLAAVSVLKDAFDDHLRSVGRPQLHALRDDPVLGLYAHVMLTEPDQAVQLPPRLQQWAALEAVAVAVEGGAFDKANPLDADGLAPLWQIVEEDADLDSAWTSDHPQLRDVLDAIATHHPRDRVRKAAKKALFKARQREH